MHRMRVGYGLLNESAEQQATLGSGAPVEPDDVLVEVVRQMVVADAAVQGASEPAFEEGHTAGLTQEAPIGSNNELDPGSFDAHVRSISDTWLRFPVGSGYAYSNLGIDLAGYILERVQDKPFAAVMRDSLLGPLGMERSTFDRTAIRSTSDRAVGHADPYPEPPVEVPMTAAGGLYSSVADLARFLAFQLNDGSMTVGCSSIRSRSRSSGRSRPRTPTHTRAPSDGECMEAAQRHPARLASNI